MKPCFDSHAHMDVFVQEDLVDEVMARARDAGVMGVIAIGGDPEANERAVTLASQRADIWATVGMDRDWAGETPDEALLLDQLSRPRVVGVGETGLDYHYSADTRDAQCELFSRMLDLACRSQRPVVVHTREAEEDTLHHLRAYASRWSGAAQGPGVIHCYTGGPAFARSLMDLGFMISFSGIVSFKNAEEIRAAARIVPDDLLLIETDAPYLAPVPFRGKRNEPAWVRHVAEAVAIARGVTVDEIAQITADNTRRLFRL